MIINNLSRQKQLPLSTTVRSLTRHLSTSKLRDRYSFEPPPSLSSNPQETKSTPTNPNKKQKPKYRPPSSLDQIKPIRSDLPFDFRFSYTESSPIVRPIGLREPKYSPFGSGRLDREWTGVCAPAVEPKVKSVEGSEVPELEAKRKLLRGRIQGAPLTEAERKFLVEKCQRSRTKRQINLGRDGLTHNMLNDIHNHWKFDEAVRIKCLGVPTVDMKNVCAQLEDKTYGYYSSLVPMVRDAFLVSELVRIHCTGLERSDYKKIGCKLRDLVPCILVTFEKEQIVVWRGKDYKPPEDGHFLSERELFDDPGCDVERSDSSDESKDQ